MSNKVIFNYDELFISVGIDVGADFSWMSIALPNQQLVGKPYKLLHSSMYSLTTAVSIKKCLRHINSPAPHSEGTEKVLLYRKITQYIVLNI